MIINRNLALKRVGDRIYLPTTGDLFGMATPEIPNKPYLMCTISNYDEYTGVMELKLKRGEVKDYHFGISVEVNSDLLLSLNLKKLVIHHAGGRSILPPMQFPNHRPSTYVKQHIADAPYSFGNSGHSTSFQGLAVSRPLDKVVINITVDMPVKDLQFLDGKVSFEHYVKEVSKNVTFHVENPSLKKEYDSVKNYFSKALDTKKFTFNLKVELLAGSPLEASATSPHIDKINDSLFEIVEELYIDDYFVSNQEDEVYDVKERVRNSAKEIGSDKLQDADYLLNKLITKEKTKHYYHLRYLSHNHLSNLFNLHLTGKPLSFIFLLPNGNDFCLVWETYNTSEATYLWKQPHNGESAINKEVSKIIEKIKWLRKGKKLTYLKEKHEGFTRIEHDYSSEDFGFKKWKAQLDSFLNNNNLKS